MAVLSVCLTPLQGRAYNAVYKDANPSGVIELTFQEGAHAFMVRSALDYMAYSPYATTAQRKAAQWFADSYDPVNSTLGLDKAKVTLVTGVQNNDFLREDSTSCGSDVRCKTALEKHDLFPPVPGITHLTTAGGGLRPNHRLANVAPAVLAGRPCKFGGGPLLALLAFPEPIL